jgi:fructose-1,6-bisphosphatase II
VLSAAALRCLGGVLAGRLYPRNDEERRAELEAGYDLDRILTQDDLCKGEDVFFSATGVTDGDVLQGVGYDGVNGATTESLVMRTRSGTVRGIQSRHDRQKVCKLTGYRLV